MNVPNILTLFRIVLIPLLVIFLIEGKYNYGLLVFVTAAVTDGLDGFIARVFKQKTKIGAFVDPLADKLLIGTSYITLAILKHMPNWLAVIVVSRDIIILTGILILFLNGKSIEIKPLIDSKLTTLSQLLTVCFFLGFNYLHALKAASPYLVFFTAAITLFSGFHYILIGFTILGNSNNNSPTIKK